MKTYEISEPQFRVRAYEDGINEGLRMAIMIIEDLVNRRVPASEYCDELRSFIIEKNPEV